MLVIMEIITKHDENPTQIVTMGKTYVGTLGKSANRRTGLNGLANPTIQLITIFQTLQIQLHQNTSVYNHQPDTMIISTIYDTTLTLKAYINLIVFHSVSK